MTTMSNAEIRETIALDIDEVLFPFIPQFVRWHNGVHQTNFRSDDFFTYEFDAVLGLSVSDTVSRVHEFLEQRDNHENVAPIEGSENAVYALAERYSLVAVTARNPRFRAVTEVYLNDCFGGNIEHVELIGHPASMEACKSKAEACQKLGVAALIDDSVRHVNGCVDNGIDGILFGDYPWNGDDELREGVTRCRDWPDVLGYLGIQLESSQAPSV